MRALVAFLGGVATGALAVVALHTVVIAEAVAVVAADRRRREEAHGG